MATFEQEVLQAVSSNREYQREVKNLIKNSFERKKILMLKDFDQHPVTQELSNPQSSNVSSTLGGYGNLFGFIGFVAGSDPIGPVEEKLKELVQLESISFSSSTVSIKYNVPELSDFDSVAPYQGWREGGNWLKGIERGISGLKFFRSTLGEKGKGRSGLGFQTKGAVKPFAGGINRFQNKKYMTSIVNSFKSSLDTI